MLPDEMIDLEAYDYREKHKEALDPTSRLLYEIGNLILVYNEMKNRQMYYLSEVNSLKNMLRKKYYELQVEVDKYNNVKRKTI